MPSFGISGWLTLLVIVGYSFLGDFKDRSKCMSGSVKILGCVRSFGYGWLGSCSLGGALIKALKSDSRMRVLVGKLWNMSGSV